VDLIHRYETFLITYSSYWVTTMRYGTNSANANSQRSSGSFLAERSPRKDARSFASAAKRASKPVPAPPKRLAATRRPNSQSNQYRCSIERNQAGKFGGRIRAHFARQDWDLNVFFVAASLRRATQKLEQTLRFLQLNEERLWFWGVDRSDDPNFAAELLSEAGLKLDQRAEFPRRSALIAIAPDRDLLADTLALIRREFGKLNGNVRAGGD
jgi:hypothetical protein